MPFGDNDLPAFGGQDQPAFVPSFGATDAPAFGAKDTAAFPDESRKRAALDAADTKLRAESAALPPATPEDQAGAEAILSEMAAPGVGSSPPPGAPGAAGDAVSVAPAASSLPAEIGQNVAEFGKGIVPGAMRLGGTALKGAAGNIEGANRAVLSAFDQIDAGARPDLSVIPPSDIGAVESYRLLGPEQRASIRQRYEAASGPTTDNALYKAGEAVSEASKGVLPAAPGYEDSTGRQLGEGMGSLLGGAAVSMLPGGRSLGPILFAAAGSGEAVERAVEAGATEDQIVEAARQGLIPGMTDSVPVETLLGRLPFPGGKFISIPANMLGKAIRAVGRVGWTAVLEGVQEGGQKWLQNLIAKDVYKPEQDPTEGVLPEAAMGAGVGGIAQTGKELGSLALRNFAGRRGGSTGTPQEPSEQGQDAQEAPEAGTTPEASDTATSGPEIAVPEMAFGQDDARAFVPEGAVAAETVIGQEAVAVPEQSDARAVPAEDAGRDESAGPAPAPDRARAGDAAPDPQGSDPRGRESGEDGRVPGEAGEGQAAAVDRALEDAKSALYTAAGKRGVQLRDQQIEALAKRHVDFNLAIADLIAEAARDNAPGLARAKALAVDALAGKMTHLEAVRRMVAMVRAGEIEESVLWVQQNRLQDGPTESQIEAMLRRKDTDRLAEPVAEEPAPEPDVTTPPETGIPATEELTPQATETAAVEPETAPEEISPAQPAEPAKEWNGLDYQNAIMRAVDQSVFQDRVAKPIQRDGQRFLDAVAEGDVEAIRALAKKYERDAGLSQGGGGAGPGRVKSPRSGAATLGKLAIAALDRARTAPEPTQEAAPAPEAEPVAALHSRIARPVLTSKTPLNPEAIAKAQDIDPAQAVMLLQEMARRGLGIPAEADPPVFTFETDQPMKAHADYDAAKSGDIEAAVRLVRDMVEPGSLAAAARRFGPDAVFVPVHSEERAGRNKIPMALAHAYAAASGGDVVADIVEANRAFHTGANAIERLIARPTFDGPVEAGRRYVLVDDVTTLGGTLAELADHIRQGGGEVAGVVTLVNAGRERIFTPAPKLVREIERRYGDEIRNLFGVEPGSLTANEARYIINFRDADALGNRVAAARRQRSERLRAQGVRPDEGRFQQEVDETLGEPGETQARFRFSPAFNDKREAVYADLRKEMDRIGIKGVTLRLPEQIEIIEGGETVGEAAGHYLGSVISVSLRSPDARGTLRHEIIHALRDFGLFTDPEWNVLERASKNLWRKPRKQGGYDIDTRYAGVSEDVLSEEGIAEAYARWRDGTAQFGGIVRRAFIKIRQFIEALGNALRGNGFQTADDVFSRVESGEVGGREGATSSDTQARPAAASRFAAAFHGTPHDFDEFTTEKIGTGEGAQAFGYGLYFAGKREVAEYYKEALADRVSDTKTPEGAAARALGMANGDKAGAIKTLESNKRAFEKSGSPRAQEYIDAIALVERGFTGKGRLYAVDLAPAESDYLLWDKPLSEQSEKVKAALKKAWLADPDAHARQTGETIYRKTEASAALDFERGISQDERFDRAAALALNEAGIPGIKYLDGQSRNKPLKDIKREFLAELPEDAEVDEVSDLIGTGHFSPKFDAVLTALKNDDWLGFDYPSQAISAAYSGRLDNWDASPELVTAVSDSREDGTYNYVIFDAKNVKVTGKFQRIDPETPDTVEARQNIAQGFLAKGQPIDRALRVPFDWFGGVNEKGEWQPGAKLYDAAENAIKTAKFSDEGPFRWMNGPMEAARAGLIDRYGLDPEYVRRERRLDLDKREIAEKGADILQGLAKSNIGTDEAKVLQAVLTGEQIAEGDMAKLSAPIRQAIDELGAEAVSLGLVSPESYERNRGTYLHRVYMKHEGDQPTLSRWFTSFMTGRRKKIQGDAFKGRGMFLEVDTARAMQDISDFAEGKRGAPVKGETFTILDQYAEQGTLEGMEPSASRIERRVYLPAGQKVPSQYKDFADQGTWEVRQVGKNKVVLWRDFTKAERAKMGEILDARYTIGKTFMLMAQDLSTGRFYRDIATNNEWTRTATPNGKWVNATEFRRLWQDDSVEWVKVPDTDIPNTGGKKRWGALAGKFVRAEIWRDLNEADILSRPNLWTQLLTQWKLNKTARSPVVHMNNVMSNMIFMDLADVRVQDLARGILAYYNETADFKEAQANGAFGSDMISQEIKRNVLQPILDDIQRDMSGGNPVTVKFGLLGKLADAIWTAAKAADRGMVEMYRLEDEIFRMAMYMRRRSMGDSAENAANEAREQFLDYDIRAPWVNKARRSVLPFLSYTYRAVPVIARSIATRPWKLAKYFMLAQAASYMAYMMAPGDDDEERRSMREEERGYTWIGVPRMQRMPYRDEHGNPVFLDIRRWIPAGDVFDISQGHGAFSIPAWIQFGGPLMLAAEVVLNKTAFTGKEITNDLTDTGMDKAGKIADWAWKSWMPSAAWIPGSWYWEKIGLALDGATDREGRAYPVPEAIASSFGVKLKPQDVESNLDSRAYEFKKARLGLRAEERRILRLRERNIVSEEAMKEAVDSIDAKRRIIDQREAEIFPRK